MAEHLAVLRLDQAGGDPEQGRLAGAVAADQRDAVAGQHRKRGAVEQRRAAEGQADVVELEKRWRHVRSRICGVGMREQQRAAGCQLDRELAGHLVGYGERGAERHGDAVERPARAADAEARSGRKSRAR